MLVISVFGALIGVCREFVIGGVDASNGSDAYGDNGSEDFVVVVSSGGNFRTGDLSVIFVSMSLTSSFPPSIESFISSFVANCSQEISLGMMSLILEQLLERLLLERLYVAHRLVGRYRSVSSFD